MSHLCTDPFPHNPDLLLGHEDACLLNFLYDGTKNSLFMTDKEDNKIGNTLVIFEVLQKSLSSFDFEKKCSDHGMDYSQRPALIVFT
jgi:hypothetical protein